MQLLTFLSTVGASVSNFVDPTAIIRLGLCARHNCAQLSFRLYEGEYTS